MKSLLSRDRVWFEDPLRLIPRILTRLYSAWVGLTYPFAHFGHDVSIHYTWEFRKYLARRVSIGSSILIGKDVHFGISSPDRMEKGEPVISIGDNCVIVRRVQISARNGVHVERNVVLAANVLVMDHNHGYENIDLPIRDQGDTLGGRIRIEEGCWVGAGAAIVCSSGELVLGRNCVVAANALVTRSFPPYSVLVGNPARVVRQYDPDKKSWQPEFGQPRVQAEKE
jgi:acetyltransferase-like isoleucine patch superfamily enzyme